jgi:2-polyprenyl-3-methyl-5-hydroxy-6-metoxy-1,4-benzoquinol methylase
MESSGLEMLVDAVRKGRRAIRRWNRARLPGQFQPYSHTLPDRYPWLFQFASATLGNHNGLRVLSFGCSKGLEVCALRKWFPTASLKGIDIDPHNIEACAVHTRNMQGITFATAATTQDETTESYDAIFCLAVLCHGDLTASGAERCDSLLRFDQFEYMVADFSRCLKPGGLLFLHTTNFRFCDTITAREFDPVLRAEPAQLAADVLFDRDNRLMRGVRYHDVGFRKRRPPVGSATLPR